ncbi:hypothetical protein [Anderseniella sp. Alg231-50]|uniref:hypothetical protein n=1 Tax=Anderseniella sp. Alg231-50 TaxID=1922226 RepID=UPI00307BEC38
MFRVPVAVLFMLLVVPASHAETGSNTVYTAKKIVTMNGSVPEASAVADGRKAGMPEQQKSLLRMPGQTGQKQLLTRSTANQQLARPFADGFFCPIHQRVESYGTVLNRMLGRSSGNLAGDHN